MGGQAPIRFRHKLAHGRRKSTIWALAALLLALMPTPSQAHEIRPAIADVTVSADQVDIEIFVTLEALVAQLDLANLLDTNQSPLAARYDDLRAMEPESLKQAFTDAWPVIAPGFRLKAGTSTLGLLVIEVEVPPVGDISLPRESRLHLRAKLPPDGTAVTMGWSPAFGPLVVRQVVDAGDGYSGYLTGGEDSAPLPRSGTVQQPWLTDFLDFIGIGFTHIVPKGLDHILFVLGLFFFSLHLRPLLYQVTSFTVAHTVSLALGVLGIVQVPAGIVEPLIAASIVYVAVENVLVSTYRPWRSGVVFGFGLLHGLGFAAVLGDIGLTPARFATGLIGFNLGVELGQLAVITGAFLAVGVWFGRKPWYDRVIANPISVAIAIVGAFWFIQRVFF